MLIVDRFEGDWAVIEYGTTLFNFPRAVLPSEVKEGDVLAISISVDQATTQVRRQRTEEMMKGFYDS